MMHHPDYGGFAWAQKSLRAKCTAWVHFTCVISLPFTVQTPVHEKHNLAWRDDGTKLVYVCLKAVAGAYAIEHDKDGFDLL